MKNITVNNTTTTEKETIITNFEVNHTALGLLWGLIGFIGFIVFIQQSLFSDLIYPIMHGYNGSFNELFFIICICLTYVNIFTIYNIFANLNEKIKNSLNDFTTKSFILVFISIFLMIGYSLFAYFDYNNTLDTYNVYIKNSDIKYNYALNEKDDKGKMQVCYTYEFKNLTNGHNEKIPLDYCIYDKEFNKETIKTVNEKILSKMNELNKITK